MTASSIMVDKEMAKGRLSVCMIVRNEEAVLSDCLGSVTEVADQLVVVDTGSTDDTITIASSYGAEIYHFQWINDFAAARNESIKYATGDWILWLDADERLLESSIEPLKRLLAPFKCPVIYQVHIRNLQRDGQSYTVSMSHRLFSRHPRLRFSGRIHEQVHPSLKTAGGIEKPSEIMLEHKGYALEEDQMRAKFHRNMVLLEAMVEEQPDSAYAHYTLGQNHALLGEQEKALQAYLRALEINVFKGSSVATLYNALAETCWQLDRFEEAENYALKSLAITERQTSGNYIMYRIRHSTGNIPGQIEYLERILPYSHQGDMGSGSDLPKDVSLPRQHLLFSLGKLYISNENFSSAEKVLKEYLEQDPERTEVRELLATVLARQNRWEEFLSILVGLQQPLSKNLRELYGVALVKLQRFKEAIVYYQAWLEEEPAHEGLRRRLAGLYAKMGDRQAAERLLNK